MDKLLDLFPQHSVAHEPHEKLLNFYKVRVTTRLGLDVITEYVLPCISLTVTFLQGYVYTPTSLILHSR